MTKQDEINLLREFTKQAKAKGAGYLSDALLALQLPFTQIVASDFPGHQAVQTHRDTIDHLQGEIAKLREQERVSRERLNEEDAKLQRISKDVGHHIHQLAKIEEEAKQILSSISFDRKQYT